MEKVPFVLITKRLVDQTVRCLSLALLVRLNGTMGAGGVSAISFSNQDSLNLNHKGSFQSGKVATQANGD